LNGRTETITDRAGNTSVYAYDRLGNVIRIEQGGTVTTMEYHTWSDGTLSHLKKSETISGLIANSNGDLEPQTLTTRYYYEDESGPVRDDGLLRQVVDPLGNVTRFTYDERGNLLTVVDGE